MTSISGKDAEFFGELYSSIPASVNVSSGVSRRKRSRDDASPLHASNVYSEVAKRQKYGTSCYETPDSGVSVSDEHESNTFTVLEKSRPSSSHDWNEPQVQDTSISGEEAASPETSRKSQKDTMNIIDRKQRFIYMPGESIIQTMKSRVSDLYKLFDVSRIEDDCWLHPCPPPPQRNGRPKGSIPCAFRWTDTSGLHALNVNIGVVALIVEHHLTNEQMEGFINEAWQLSHLCGNWTCCNWRHFTMESGPINVSRNRCFKSPAKCTHNPPCMKQMKRQLLVTDLVRSNISLAITSLGRARSDTDLRALDAQENRLMEGFWENGERGLCAFCGRYRCDAHICSSLSSIAHCRVLLKALKQCAKPTTEITQAIADLVKIKEDLERSSATAAKPLKPWFAGFGKRKWSWCLPSNMSHTSQELESRTGLMLAYQKLKNKRDRLRKKNFDLRAKSRNADSATKDAKLFARVTLSYRETREAMTKAYREMKKVSKEH